MAYEKSTAENRVIIVGAGIGGLAAGIGLKTQLGCTNFTIYETANDVGGTWRGCASDVHTHWYSLSTDLNPEWDNTHVFQPQLFRYWQDVARKYSLYEHCTFQTEVVGAEWDDRRQLWHVEVKDLRTGERRVDSAKAVISGVGVLCVPFYPPDLDGVKTKFKGQYFHSARWDYSVDLHNKRVAVIGNGCSAAQFAPIIAEDPTTQVVNFARTPMWFFPRIRRIYTGFEKWVFRNVPFAMRLYRWGLMAWFLTNYMKKNAPEKYHDVLKPDYPFGCKRLIVDTGYYDMLHKPNVSLVVDGIAEITETGIVTKKGEHLPFDVIILATGFVVDKFPFPVRGREGISIDEYNNQHGGPTAYLGTTVPGFPNFFMLGGPNTTTGHGSVIFTEEVQVNYAMKMLKPLLRGEVASFDVTEKATDKYNEKIQRRLNSAVWSVCESWYRVGHTGKISSLWPGSFVEFWWALRTPKWSDYTVVGAERWVKRRRIAALFRTILYGLVLAGAISVYKKQDQVKVLWMWLSSELMTVIPSLRCHRNGIAAPACSKVKGYSVTSVPWLLYALPVLSATPTGHERSNDDEST
ncbi:FAD/NAD-P-binding domain-containing protein [Panus rudis PR-1116 ss-1]|nr:FAD/NAD-P-binding domain-containing protein [Panus rudis PR-1116 ss-1]